MKTTIIIPFYNEEENVESVLNETLQANPEAEIIAVNDGSSDQTEAVIRKHTSVQLISFERHLGQSAAIYAGLRSAQNDICAIMDGDGQYDPKDIPKITGLIGEVDVVCGYRSSRQDSLGRRVSSWAANGIRRMILHDNIRDTGCGLKAFKRKDVRYLLPFDGLHRYLPVFFDHAGLRVIEVTVNHRPRRHGQSKYTIPARAISGIYDLIGVRWLVARKIWWPTGQEHDK